MIIVSLDSIKFLLRLLILSSRFAENISQNCLIGTLTRLRRYEMMN